MAAVGLVVGNSGSLTSGDSALQSLLTGDGHTVTVLDDATAPDGSRDVYVISESCTGSLPSSTYAALAVPVVTLDIGSWDDMSLAAVPNDANLGSSRFFDLDTHDITAGLTLSDCQVRTTNGGMWGTPGGAANLAPAAEVFAVHTDDATETMGFAVDAGGNLVTGTTPARRVALAYIDNWIALLTADGQTLLLQAVDWALASDSEEHAGTGQPSTVDVTLGIGAGAPAVGNAAAALLIDLTFATGQGSAAESSSGAGLPLLLPVGLGTALGVANIPGDGAALVVPLDYGIGTPSGFNVNSDAAAPLGLDLTLGTGVGGVAVTRPTIEDPKVTLTPNLADAELSPNLATATLTPNTTAVTTVATATSAAWRLGVDKIKQNDTAPSAEATLKDGDTAVDLTGATVKFAMAVKAQPTKVFAPAVVTDAPNGKVRYDWQPGDTDTPGAYQVEWEVTWGDGTIQTFPPASYLSLTITQELDTSG